MVSLLPSVHLCALCGGLLPAAEHGNFHPRGMLLNPRPQVGYFLGDALPRPSPRFGRATRSDESGHYEPLLRLTERIHWVDRRLLAGGLDEIWLDYRDEILQEVPAGVGGLGVRSQRHVAG